MSAQRNHRKIDVSTAGRPAAPSIPTKLRGVVGKLIHGFSVAPVALSLMMAACSADPANGGESVLTGSTKLEAVGTVTSAETVGEKTIDNQSGINLTETSASAFQASDGTWEMYTSSNSAGGRFDYSCTANNYATWCPNAIFLGNGNGNNQVIGDTNSVSAQGHIYAVALRGDQTGFWFIRTADPCPGRNGACLSSSPWDTSLESVGATGSIDFPDIIRNPVNSDVWIVYRRNGPTAQYIGLARFSNGQTWNTNLAVFETTCNVALDRVRAAFDSSGNIHIAYQDKTHTQMHHEIFSTATNTFSGLCNDIGPYTLPPTGCGCSLPIIQGVSGGQCLRSLIAPSITVDTDVNPNVILVAYETPGTGSCTTTTETHLYRSTNNGSTWTLTMDTGCQTDVQPRVVFPNQAGDTAGHVQMQGTYVTPPGTLAQAEWDSSDYGQTWGGFYITAQRTVAQLGGCYSGDYNAIAPDSAHGSYFYGYSELSGSNWVNQGIVENQ